MALKPDRKYTDGTDISYFMNSAMERGGICVFPTSGGSGAAMDQAANVVTPTGSTASGTYPVGVLMCDMVNKNLAATHLNPHKDEIQLGGKVTILKRGQIVTNMLQDGVSITPGAPAYYQVKATVTGVDGTTYSSVYVFDNTSTNSRQVGNWASGKDEDGYAKIDINLT